MTVKDGRSVGPENCGKMRGKRAENVRTIVPVEHGMELRSRYQCLIPNPSSTIVGFPHILRTISACFAAIFWPSRTTVLDCRLIEIQYSFFTQKRVV